MKVKLNSMEGLIIYPTTKTQLNVLTGLLKEMKIPFKKASDNPSPSNDPYFKNVSNIKELERRLSNPKNKKSIVINTDEELKKFLGV